MPALSAREGYRLWAPHYAEETAVSALEDIEVHALGVSVEGRRLLDVGCGVGRRLKQSGASLGVGVDLVPDMLPRAAGEGRRATGGANAEIRCAAADVRALPFDGGTFDVVWCRLVLGHVRDIAGAYRELARVCAIGGVVIVSDLHTDAVAAGHRRTFRDSSGTTHELEHFAYSFEKHTECAIAGALAFDARRVGVVGPAIEHFYTDAHRERAYAAQRGLPLVSVMSWRKTGEAA